MNEAPGRAEMSRRVRKEDRARAPIPRGIGDTMLAHHKRPNHCTVDPSAVPARHSDPVHGAEQATFFSTTNDLGHSKAVVTESRLFYILPDHDIEAKATSQSMSDAHCHVPGVPRTLRGTVASDGDGCRRRVQQDALAQGLARAQATCASVVQAHR